LVDGGKDFPLKCLTEKTAVSNQKEGDGKDGECCRQR
jgi:hypothetical protein